jgi:hypothetical protein
VDREGDDGARARGPAQGAHDGSGPHDLDLDAQIDDLAAELQFDDAVGMHGLDDFADDADIEEIDPELDELAEALPDIPEPRRLWLELDGRVHVVDKERYVIGRVSGQCDLAIIDANVSRQHCAIELHDGQFVVKDLGSTNGIEIDGHRIDDHRIRDGEVLVLSGHELRCSFSAPLLTVAEPIAVPAAIARTEAPALTGHFPPIPSHDEHGHELEPEPQPEPEPEHEPEPEWPESFEERMELRLHLLATEVAEMRGMMRELVTSLDALKVDALAQLIQSRLQKARRP